MDAADAGREPLVELDRARLLERVDDRLRVAAGGERRAGVEQPPRGADAVGEVALGGRAEAGGHARAAEQRDVVVGQVRRVDGGEALRQRAGVGQQPGRRAAVRREALLVLLRLLGDVGVQRPPRRPLRDGARRRRVDRAHAVDRRADARGRALLERVHALGPGAGVGVAEARDAAVQVARVEQRDADARVGGRRQHRAAHRVRVVVGRAVGRVVEVVELADAGDAGQRHLAERRAREREAAVGVERAGERVHLLAPGPERARLRVRAPAQRALERVRVGVGEARQRQPREAVDLDDGLRGRGAAEGGVVLGARRA